MPSNLSLVPHLALDIRHALRRWKARPLFAAAGGVTLALGIAATATIFSLTDAALFKPLPWRNPDNLVTI